MQIEQIRWEEGTGWQPEAPGKFASEAQLVLVFGGSEEFQLSECIVELEKVYGRAKILGCSTAGEICGDQVLDNSLVVTAVHFEHTEIKTYSEILGDPSDSYQVGSLLANALDKEGLVHAFVISDGLRVNGSELVRGLLDCLPGEVTVTGGLSGDGDRFEHTQVAWCGPPEEGRVGILGFYGNRLRVGCGSLGGWNAFGPERLITRSEGNILYELDGKPALQLYKKYLGEDHANGLPATGLLFPLTIRGVDPEHRIVRTILAVDEKSQSITFAGDLPEGDYVRLMKANFNQLVDGAADAAKASAQSIGAGAELAVLVSCVGRKLVLKQIVDEEVEAVREVLGPETVFTGFYSYGEISPFSPGAKCELHNQTMTVTTFAEI